MTRVEQPAPEHPNSNFFIRAIDDELSPEEEDALRSHLGACEECRRAYQNLAVLSSEIQSALTSTHVEPSAGERQAIVNWLAEREQRRPKASASSSRASLQIGAGIAAAAALAFGIVVAHKPQMKIRNETGSPAAQKIETFEIADEIFTALPYSNRDLPLNAPEIVQMRVPVASLAGTGLYQTSALSLATGTEDATVLADVLLGADGQPLGVHVLNRD